MELLIVMAVILILAAIMVKSWPDIKERIVRLHCQTNLSKAQKIFIEYGANNSGYLPPVTGSGTNGWSTFYGLGSSSENRPNCVVLELKEYGASADIFTCPAWTSYGDPDYYVNKGWEDPRKYTWTAGYVMYIGYYPWLPSNWQWYPWLLPNARKKANRIDSPGDLPLVSDEMNYDPGSTWWSGLTWRGFYHWRDRDEYPDTPGGGGYTVFLNGAVQWYSWEELLAKSQEEPAPLPFHPTPSFSRRAYAGWAPRQEQ
ncbi:MAG: hypothetical protein GWP05_06755 [Anaerolineaceae bacterium]|nr:hypothetical protein [Anaerolineaceae bacterium]